LKRALRITWRYRPLWIFGFLLALCGGGGGGGGGGNFNFSTSGRDFENLPNQPDIDPGVIITVIVAVVILALLLALIGIVVRQVTRAALIGMVHRITETAAVTAGEGWRIGWSARAWRIFLLNLVIGIPLTLLALFLLLLASSPLLLLLANTTAAQVIGIVLAVLAFLVVIFVLIIINAVINPLQELAWRRTVLAERGVMNSLRDAFNLIRRSFKDVAILWLLLLGIGIAWAIVGLIVVLPVSLLAAAVVGGIPALLVWWLSGSWWGAAIAGVPPGLIVLILVSSFASGLYLTYRSAVWTLGYLNLPDVTPVTSPVPGVEGLSSDRSEDSPVMPDSDQEATV
jgi:hypothetical protein